MKPPVAPAKPTPPVYETDGRRTPARSIAEAVLAHAESQPASVVDGLRALCAEVRSAGCIGAALTFEQLANEVELKLVGPDGALRDLKWYRDSLETMTRLRSPADDSPTITRKLQWIDRASRIVRGEPEPPADESERKEVA
jgi:hypothetical protein